MEDGEKNQNVEKDPPRQPIAGIFNARTIFQSFWIRCHSIFPNITDRKFMEGELRFVLYSGFILWTVYLAYEILK